MNTFVKWLRKNNMKLMAVVIIVLMVGFIGGTSLQRYLQSRASGRERVIAYFADGEEIKNQDLLQARNELSILKSLRSDMLLTQYGLNGMLLNELIFSEGKIRPQVFQYINRTIVQNDCLISQKQLAEIYNKEYGSNLYWLLLKKESQKAGIRISKEMAANVLSNTIPQLFQNVRGDASYQNVISAIVNESGVPEEEILSTFSELFSVIQYGRMACSAGDVTENEIRYLVSSRAGSLNAEFVRMDSLNFLNELQSPTEQEISRQFAKYQNTTPLVTEDNPYGFGYKLPASVQLEYIGVKLSDVEEITAEPTQEDAEQFYRQNRSRFTEEVPVDPNDPNSETTERQQSYSEVADQIFSHLRQSRINSQAQKILQQAKDSALTPVEEIGKPWEKLTDKDFRENTPDYALIEKNLEDEYGINVFSGKTGLLSGQDIQQGRYLSRLYTSSGNGLTVPLVKIAFSLDKFDIVDLSLYNISEPRLYESFGPLRDRNQEIMTVVRVTRAEKERATKDINHTIDKTLMHLTEANDTSLLNREVSVRERVVEDLEKKAGMELASETAANFIANVKQNGWDESLNQLNQQFKDPADANIPNVDVFRLQNSTLRRIAELHIQTIKAQNADNPSIAQIINNIKSRKALSDKMYSLIPADSNSLQDSPAIVEAKPEFAVYVVKDATIDQINRRQFQQNKPMQVFRKDNTITASMSAIHYNPKNIIKRMNVEWEEERPAVKDSNDTLPEADTTDTDDDKQS